MMKRTVRNGLAIGISAIASVLILNSLGWAPSPWRALAQDQRRIEDQLRTDVKEPVFDAEKPTPGNPNPPNRGSLMGGAGTPQRFRKGYRPSVQRVGRQVSENGQVRIVYEDVMVMVPDPNARKKEELNAAIQTALQSYQTAADEDSRKKNEELLTSPLSELFDLQQAEREEQLKPMEERVKKLRETLNKRAALRDDLIQLRLKVLLQDAEGLGWGTDDEFLPRTILAEPPATNLNTAPPYEPNRPADDHYRPTTSPPVDNRNFSREEPTPKRN